MKLFACAIFGSLLLASTAALAQDGDLENIVVTAQRRVSGGPLAVVEPRPVIGIRRQADSAIRNVEITSDSLDDGMRRREVRAMLFDAIDRAKKQGFNIVTGQFTVTEVTRDNWQDLYPDLARGNASNYSNDDESWQNDNEDDDNDNDNDEDAKPKPRFEDDGSKTTLRLMVKTKLVGTIDEAERKISAFVKSVPENGRAQLKQKAALSLTIIKPEQYRDEIYKLVASGAQFAGSFYGPEYGLEVNGLHGNVAWEQVSETELFVFIRYNFAIKK